MTDKEHIKTAVKSKLNDLLLEIQCEVPNEPKQIIEGKITAYREVLALVNSMQEESVSEEDLEEAAQRYNEDMSWRWEAPNYPHLEAFKTGAQWQKEQLMAKAVDAVVKIDAGGYPYVDRTIELYDYDKDIPLAKKGDKYKVILIKEDKI